MGSGLEEVKNAVSGSDDAEDIGDLQSLTSDVQELERYSQNLYLSIVSDFEDLIEDAESGIDSSPSPDVWFVGNPSDFASYDKSDFLAGDFLIALSLAILNRKHGENVKVENPVISSIKMNLLNNQLLENRFFRPEASYSRKKDNVYFATITDVMASNYTSGDIPDVLKPLMLYLRDTSVQGDVMKYNILHEFTHGYINERAGGERDNVERAIDEACAHVVSYICGRKDTDANAYGEKGIEKKDMQTAEYVLHQKVEDLNAVKAIEQVREHGAEAVSKHRNGRTGLLASLGIRNSDLVDSLDPEDKEEARELKSSLAVLQEVEYRTFHIMNLLGFLSMDEVYSHVKKFDEVVNAQYYEGNSKFFPDESPLGEKIVDMDVESFLEEDNSSIESFESENELRTTIKEFETGLKDLERLVQEENVGSKEKEEVKDFIQEFREFLQNYEDEEVKIDNQIEKLDNVTKNYDGDTKEIYFDSNSTKSYNTVDNLEKTIIIAFKAYANALKAGKSYNQRLLSLSQKLHDEETVIGKIVKKNRDKALYDDLERLMDLTEDINRICSAAESEFEKSLELLEENKPDFK